MENETQTPAEETDVQFDESQADSAFGAAAEAADEQVRASSADGGLEGLAKPEKKPAKAAGSPEGGTEGGKPDDGKGGKKEGAEGDGEESDASKAKTEAEQLAEAQKEAEERAIVAAEAEKKRKEQAEAAQKAQVAPMDVAAATKAVRDALKSVKIEGFDNFEAFEKEYGNSLTEAITAIAAEVARNAVAPIYQAQQQARITAAHDKFIAKMVEIGHPDISDIEKSDDFWSWLQQDENSKLRYLVEKADIKGTDMVVRAYKAEKGIKTPAAGKPATEREALLAKQQADRKRADAVNRVTGRRQQSVQPEGGGDEIKDESDAERLFSEVTKQHNEANAAQSFR